MNKHLSSSMKVAEYDKLNMTSIKKKQKKKHLDVCFHRFSEQL